MYGKNKFIKYEAEGNNFETMNTTLIKQILKNLTQLIFMVKFSNRKIKWGKVYCPQHEKEFQQSSRY